MTDSIAQDVSGNVQGRERAPTGQYQQIGCPLQDVFDQQPIPVTAKQAHEQQWGTIQCRAGPQQPQREAKGWWRRRDQLMLLPHRGHQGGGH